MQLRPPRLVSLLAGLVATTAAATPRDQAYLLYNRVNSVPPSAATLDALTAQIASGDLKGAAMAAINDPAGMFYNLTLRDVISRWTNTDRSPRIDLNDYTATVIGMVRDDVPFNTVLAADLVYVGDATKVAGIPAYSLANGDHYKFMDTQNSNLKDVLIPKKQSEMTTILTPDATAGVMTTRGFAESYFKAGTNRRAVAFTLDTFLCHDMSKLADTTRPDFRVRRDVTRAPGGDSALYRNRCAGCHAGMDALGGAFAYYDVDANDTLAYTAGQVQTKMNRNADQFPAGFITTDDSWLNNWLVGQNATIGWHGAPNGNGAKALGEMFMATDAFASCMAQRALTAMCLHAPTTQAELDAQTAIAAEFKSDFNMKNAFVSAAVTCTAE